MSDPFDEVSPATLSAIGTLMHRAVDETPIELPVSPFAGSSVRASDRSARRRWLVVAAVLAALAVGAAATVRLTHRDQLRVSTDPEVPQVPEVTDPSPASGLTYLPSVLPGLDAHASATVSQVPASNVYFARNGDRWILADGLSFFAPGDPRSTESLVIAGRNTMITERPDRRFIALNPLGCQLEILSSGLSRSEAISAATPAVASCQDWRASSPTPPIAAPADLPVVPITTDPSRYLMTSTGASLGFNWSAPTVPPALTGIVREILASEPRTVALRGTTAARRSSGNGGFDPNLAWIEPGTDVEITVSPWTDGDGGWDKLPDPTDGMVAFAQGLQLTDTGTFRAAIPLDEFDETAGLAIAERLVPGSASGVPLSALQTAPQTLRNLLATPRQPPLDTATPAELLAVARVGERETRSGSSSPPTLRNCWQLPRNSIPTAWRPIGVSSSGGAPASENTPSIGGHGTQDPRDVAGDL